MARTGEIRVVNEASLPVLQHGMRLLHARQLTLIWMRTNAIVDGLAPVSTTVDGHTTVEFPLLERIGYAPLGTSYVLGADHVDDAGIHRDRIDEGWVNAHWTDQGSAHGRLAILPPASFDEFGGLADGDPEVFPAGAEVTELDIESGTVLLFLGGVAAHHFESGDDGRLSYMRHYEKVAGF